jgi:trans-feruloyl-CoA hydratase/vanillin synthase
MNADTKAAPERAEADTVACEIRDGIAWVKFNRPEKRNCMSPKLNRQMLRVLDELEYRADVGVLVLTGEGTAWSAGMDLKEYFRDNEPGSGPRALAKAITGGVGCAGIRNPTSP